MVGKGCNKYLKNKSIVRYQINNELNVSTGSPPISSRIFSIFKPSSKNKRMKYRIKIPKRILVNKFLLHRSLRKYDFQRCEYKFIIF
jgi:hypothetical protein